MYRTFGKRLFDLIFSFMGLVFIGPICLIAAIAIKLDSKGPVFFKHRRMGKGGRPFLLFKFRSMAVDPEVEKKGFEPGKASRVTRVGKILRATKMDEVPQLINVFWGDMSIVGPRPEVEKYREIYTGEFVNVLSVRPGITDRASIKYRHEEEILAKSPDPERTYREIILPDKLAIALTYAGEGGVSFWGDVRLIFETIHAIFEKKSCVIDSAGAVRKRG